MKKIDIAYCRVSTEEQKTERQKVNILKACPDVVFIEEKYSGTTMNRPKWNKLMASCEKGNVRSIWFDEPSRMGRTADECYKTYKHLYFDLGVELHFIKESYISTTIYENAVRTSFGDVNSDSGDEDADKLINGILTSVQEYMKTIIEKQIYYAFKKAEDEAANLSKRSKSGIEDARRRGKRIGGVKGRHARSRKEWEAMPLIIKFYRGFGGKYNLPGVSRITGCSIKILRKYIDNIKVEQGILSIEKAKYADKRPYNSEIKGIEEFKQKADEIWMERYKKHMNWKKYQE